MPEWMVEVWSGDGKYIVMWVTAWIVIAWWAARY